MQKYLRVATIAKIDRKGRRGIMNIKSEHKDKILAVLSALFPDARIILFGSRAKDTHAAYSDVDVAIDMGSSIEPVYIGEARDMFSESTLPYKIDVVDFWSVPENMKKLILQEGVVWKK